MTNTAPGAPYTFLAVSVTTCASSANAAPVKPSNAARASLSTSGLTCGKARGALRGDRSLNVTSTVTGPSNGSIMARHASLIALRHAVSSFDF